MISTLQKNVTTHGTPVQLSASTQVTGLHLVVKAKSANTGSITLGNTSAHALNTGTSCFRLQANESVTLHLHNLSEIWIDSTVDGEGVEVLYESAQ